MDKNGNIQVKYKLIQYSTNIEQMLNLTTAAT